MARDNKIFEANFNNVIHFRPTENAHEIYMEYCRKLSRNHPSLKFYPKALEVDENGFASMQLWEFCKYFGEAFYTRNISPCVNGVLYFKGKEVGKTLEELNNEIKG